MSEPFLISINCSKILGESEEIQYTMFIDNTKMSIVYELIEWIRWMFSIEGCFYLTHENSIIHELEDIQFLSRLKTFELKPCGSTLCVHKKLYRTLLNELNLFVNWNEMKVHKYFLEKISQIKQKHANESKLSMSEKKILSNKDSLQSSIQKNLMCSDLTSMPSTELSSSNEHGKLKAMNPWEKSVANGNKVKEISEMDATFFTGTTAIENSEPKLKEPSKGRSYKKIEVSEENSSSQLISNKDSDSCTVNENSSSQSKIMKSSNISNISPVIKGSNSKSLNNNSLSHNKKSNNCTRPFSVGKILENIRQELQKEAEEIKTTPPPISEPFQEECPEEAIFNSLLSDDSKNSGEKKRKRTRKRKKSKKEVIATHEPYIPPSGSEYPHCSWSVKSPIDGLKPNHIRFNVDDEDDLMEIESIEGKDDNKSLTDICDEMKEFGSSELGKTDVNQLLIMIDKKKQALTSSTLASSSKRGEECVPDDPRLIGEHRTVEDLILLNNEDSVSGKTTTGISELENNCGEINNLLSLKDKFKNAVVIERFY